MVCASSPRMGSAAWVPGAISLRTFQITFSFHWFATDWLETWAKFLLPQVLLTSTECAVELSHLDSPSSPEFKESIWNALSLLLIIFQGLVPFFCLPLGYQLLDH